MAKTTCADQVRATGFAPDESCLRGAATHVGHDIDLFRLSWEHHNERLGWTMWFITARSLMDFFWRLDRSEKKDGTFRDDVLAVDFVPRVKWEAILKEIHAQTPASFSDYREAANKLSAHITYSRVDHAAAGSLKPSQEVTNYLLGTVARFLCELPTERRSWFGAPAVWCTKARFKG